jgi:hypothetical protein
MQAIAQALAGLGGNVRVVQIGGNGHNGNGSTGNAFTDMVMNIPEMAETFRAKVEALSGEDFETSLARVAQLFTVLRSTDLSAEPTPASHAPAVPSQPLPPGDGHA